MKKIVIIAAALMLCACRAQPQPPEPAPQVVSSDTSAETTVSTTDTTSEMTEALSEAAVPEETAEAPDADKVASGDETIAPETVIADGTEPIYPDKIAKGTY
ncbi:MAG: hypothetical protein ILP19_05015 [Oscillospiraceae bacterium]|nr:hypothetical protein [Oscillospiraceae bacterium]